MYTCEMCKGTFESGWSQEEKEAESLALWGKREPATMGVVCDDCFNKLKEKFPEQFTVAR